MQTTTLAFRRQAYGHARKLAWQFRASFDKTFDPSITFFTLDTSLLDGTDILGYDSNSVITEWSKYLYTDYTDRVISMEWTSEMDFLTSVTASIADLTLNNYDDYFTKGSGSPLDDNLLPRRPIKLLAGFGGETIPQFVGLTDKVPVVDRVGRTATLHAEDFLSFIFAKRLDQAVMYIDKRVDEILTSLFASFGVLPDQMELDVARTTVPFAFFTKDMTMGDAVDQLMKAEMGSLFMNEEGIIVFINRLRQRGNSVFTFNDTNIIDYDNSDESKIVNSVSVKAEIREVQESQPIFNLAEVIPIAAGETVSKFFQFQDPVTSADDIEFYVANSLSDSSGDDLTSDVNIVSQTLFSDTMLVEIENTGSDPLYLVSLIIYGTPAKITRTVNVIQKDQDSIDQYEEQTLEVSSPYIQDVDNANSIALTMIRHFKDYANTITMSVKGTPALQLNDVVHIAIDDINDDYVIRKFQNQTVNEPRFGQIITAQKYEIPTYFTLDLSLLNGTDVLAA